MRRFPRQSGPHGMLVNFSRGGVPEAGPVLPMEENIDAIPGVPSPKLENMERKYSVQFMTDDTDMSMSFVSCNVCFAGC